MNNLGNYYKEQEDYENMLKYYQAAIEKGESATMVNLGFYYEEQKDYDNFIKYSLMAIHKGHKKAIIRLANYYDDQKDYDNMIKSENDIIVIEVLEKLLFKGRKHNKRGKGISLFPSWLDTELPCFS